MKPRKLQLYLPALRRMGPYVALELLLPGGTLFALMLWVFQSGGRGAFAVEHGPVAAPAVIEHVVALREPHLPALDPLCA